MTAERRMQRKTKTAKTKGVVLLRIILIAGILPLLGGLSGGWTEEVSASEFPDVAVRIPVRLVLETDPGSSGSMNAKPGSEGELLEQKNERTAAFELRAEHEDSPMPEDEEHGVSRLIIQGSGEAAFGPIHYIRPDVYEYTVRRIDTVSDVQAGSAEDAREDAQAYRVKVVVESDGKDSVIVTRDGEEGKTDLVFYDHLKEIPQNQDTVPETEPEEIPGDNPGLDLSQTRPSLGTELSGVSESYPKTGDAAPLVIWILAFTGSLLALIIYLTVRLWEKKKEGRV